MSDEAYVVITVGFIFQMIVIMVGFMSIANTLSKIKKIIMDFAKQEEDNK